MTRWMVDIWDDEDPAVRRLREGLALRPVEEPAAEPPRAEADPSQVPLTTEERRERVAGLLERLRAGDLSAGAILRRILDK